MSEYVVGTVKWFDTKKGYGFIAHEGKDVFLHSKRLRESNFVAKDVTEISLKEGEKLKFKILLGPKGAYATEISKA